MKKIAFIGAVMAAVVVFAEENPAALVKEIEVAEPGVYELALTYRRFADRFDDVAVEVRRISTGNVIAYRMFDYHSNFPAVPSAPTRPSDYVDGPVTRLSELAFETAGRYSITVRGCYGVLNKKGYGGWRTFADAPTDVSVELRRKSAAPAAPSGFRPATVHLPSAKLNSSLPADDRLQLCMHECFTFYDDVNALLDLGINMNLQGYDPRGNWKDRNLKRTRDVPFKPNEDLAERYPGNAGKAANSRGEYSKNWSYSFQPMLDESYSNACEAVRKIVASDEDESILNWYSAWEQCGTYDYGETSVNKFRREFLPAKYGSLEELNRQWHQDYRSFDDVVPATYQQCLGKDRLTNPLELARAKASFLDFREFNSQEYAKYLGYKTRAIQANDPKKRNMTSAYSNNNLGSICWIKWRPLSFEDAMEYTLKGSKTMGWDIYGVDDLIAEAYEHWFSFGGGRVHPMIKEANIHALGSELCARSFWNLLGEGMRGMAFFTSQETPKPELRKFGFHNPDDDMAPRPKAAAVSDVFRAAAQLEPYMAYGERDAVAKPVAIFYDQNCNLLQDRGYGSMFDCAPDSHMRVFEVIRACGYPCTIVTAKQILEKNALDNLSAVFFCDAQYVDVKLVEKLKEWCGRGGHVVADGQTGVYDAHGFPTTAMVDFLGIKPIIRKRVDESAAENLTFGYSSQAFEAVNPDELWLTMREYLHQRDAKHPVAKAAGKIMVSGFGAQNVKSLDGEMLILGNNGEVGWNIRTIGKGSASYFAGYLGTLYGAGCTQYEWRDAHADDSVHRFFTALLDFFGAKRNADLALEEKYDLRVANPLVDNRGNMLSTITSFANHTLPKFRCRTYLPKDVAAPKDVLFTRDGTRRVEWLAFRYDAERHAVVTEVPSFRVFGNLLFVKDGAYPLVSAEVTGTARDAYRLPDLRPGEIAKVRVSVINPSAKPLPAGGRLTVRLPEGWFCDRETIEIGEVPAYGQSKEDFIRIAPPTVCTARRLKPVNFLYENGDTVSTPAVEMVWFQKDPQERRQDF